ncbi:MAG: OsmC family protein [Gemmatimonadaceae bacterium]
MKITLTGDDSIRLEPTDGPMTIEAPSAERQYSPFHMLGSSLAYCTFSVLYSWATHADLSIDGLVIDVSWAFSDEPHRVKDVKLAFHWPSLPPARLEAAKRVARMCTVHETLINSPTVSIEAA